MKRFFFSVASLQKISRKIILKVVSPLAFVIVSCAKRGEENMFLIFVYEVFIPLSLCVHRL